MKNTPTSLNPFPVINKRRDAAIGFLLVFFIIGYGCNAQTPAKDSLPPEQVHILNLTDTARHYAKKGNKKMALHYHKQALHKAKAAHLPEHEARALLNIANLLKNEDVDKSLAYLDSALFIAKSIQHHQLAADIYHAMGEIYKQQENYQEALLALEEHHKLLDSLFATHKAQEIAHIKTAEKQKFERTVGILCIAAVGIIAFLFAYYFYKTRRLNRKLQESNRVKDKLFSILGHDLRGPAGSIIQALPIIESGSLPPAKRQEIVEHVKAQGQAFLETLDSLLQWGKSQLQGTKVQQTKFNPQEIVTKNIEVLGGLASKKDLHIKQQFPRLFSVYADADHFDFIIRNLLSNAIKFSHPGGTITITAEEKKEEVIISVRDEGVGIPLEKQKEFDNGNLQVAYGTRGEKGTGLGLLLTKEFIKANKGNIWLESHPGQGTTFYVSLPASATGAA